MALFSIPRRNWRYRSQPVIPKHALVLGRLVRHTEASRGGFRECPVRAHGCADVSALFSPPTTYHYGGYDDQPSGLNDASVRLFQPGDGGDGARADIDTPGTCLPGSTPIPQRLTGAIAVRVLGVLFCIHVYVCWRFIAASLL